MALGICQFPQVPGGGIRRFGSRGHVPLGIEAVPKAFEEVF